MTELFVLGILNIQAMSGYDIQQKLLEWNVSIWSEVLVGSIYHALKKLEQKEYISISSIENTGHRQRAIYQITEKGKKYLSNLIKESISVSSVVYPKALYSGLTFMDTLSKEELCASLESQKKVLEDEYIRTEKALLEKKEAMSSDFSPIMQLVFEDTLSIIRLRQNFIDKLLILLTS